MKVDYKLTINGKAFKHHSRLLSLSLTDNSGFEADSLNLNLSDFDRLLQIPEKDAVIHLDIILGDNIFNMGDFKVSTLNYTNPPATLNINAISADFSSEFLTSRNKKYNDTTLKGVLDIIAGRNKLAVSISKELANTKITYLAQHNESDANLITRLAQDHNAKASIKNKKIIFVAKDDKQTPSGKEIPKISIFSSDVTSFSYQESERNEKITGIKAYYHDNSKGTRKVVIVGSDKNTRDIKKTFASKERAEIAAKSKLNELSANAKKLSLTAVLDHANVFALCPLKTKGLKEKIDAVSWQIEKVTHNLSSSGYLVNIEAVEMPKAEKMKEVKKTKKVTKKQLENTRIGKDEVRDEQY